MHLRSAALRRLMKQHWTFVLVCALALGLASSAHAEYQWIGGDTGAGGNDNWSNPNNWLNTNTGLTATTPPTSADQTRVGNNTTPPNDHSTATIDDTTGTATTANLYVSDSASNFGTLIMNGGTLNPSGSFSVGGNGNAGGNGTFLFSGGVVNMVSGQTFSLGLSASGNATTTFGNMTMSGGTFNLDSGSFQIGRIGIGSMLLSGGTLNLTGSTGLYVSNGSFTAGSSGTMTIDGGTLLMGSGGTQVSRNVGAGTLAIKSGYVDFGSGLVSMINNTGGVATMLMSGGTVKFATFRTDSGGATTGFSSVQISGGSFSGGTITVSSQSTQPANSQQFYLSQANPNVPTELSILKIGQGNKNQDIQFNGGTLTIGTIGYESATAGIYNGGTLSPGTAGVAGGGADFGTTVFPTLNPVGSNFANFIQGPNHHLHIDVGDGGATDQLTFSNGSASLNGFIDINYDGSNPQLGATYDIILAGTANAILDNSTLVSHTPGIEFSKSLFKTTNTDDTLRLTITAVPEPATLGLTGIGLIALLHRRPRRRGRSGKRTGAPPPMDPASFDSTMSSGGPPLLPC